MNAKLRPVLRGYLPLLVYFVIIIPLVLLTIFTRSFLLRFIFAGSGLFVFIIFVRELISRQRLKIEVGDQTISLPVFSNNIHWPEDIDGKILSLPGFEFKEDALVEVPYFDGRDHYNVPLEKLTGVWIQTSMSGYPSLVIGTDIFDMHFDVRHFGRKEVEEFISANFPASLRAKDSKFNSIVYQTQKKNLEQLLREQKTGSAALKSRKGWMIPLVFALPFILFLVTGVLTADPSNLVCDSVFWLTGIFICTVVFLRLYGVREVTADKKRVELKVRQRKFSIYWKDVKYFTLQAKLILWGEKDRIVIPDELLQSNKLLLHLLKVNHFEETLEAKPIFSDDFVWNKGKQD